jgi:pimeloyl-ACP methyl ester carboxylesterase
LPLYLNFLRMPVMNRFVLHLMPATGLARAALRHGMYRRDVLSAERVCRYAQFINAPGGHDSLIKTIQQVRTQDVVAVSARISEIQTPTLIVWGAHDSLLSPDQAELLHRAMPRARPVVFLEAGHLVHEEQPQATAKLVEDFLNQELAQHVQRKDEVWELISALSRSR